MYSIILSCQHQVAQNSKPRSDRMDCPTCQQSRQIIHVQEHKRDSVYGRLVAARTLGAGSPRHS